LGVGGGGQRGALGGTALLPLGLQLRHLALGDAGIEVVLQRLLDEGAQFGVLHPIDPGQGGAGERGGTCAWFGRGPVGWQGQVGALVRLQWRARA